MNQLTEQTEFDDETVAEALANSSNTEPDNDDGFEIEIIDDTPAKTEDESSKDENSESGDEVEKYSVGVQKRIDKLTKQYREEERARQEAGRLQEEALRFAQQVKTENDQLRKTLSEGEGVLVNQAKGRVTAELDKAKSAFKVAYEAGDPDALLDAQEKLNSLQGEKMRYDNYKPQPQRAEPAPQAQYQAPAPQPPRPDNRAMDWASKNEWFEKDPEMTGYAYGLHEKLVKSGIDPRTE